MWFKINDSLRELKFNLTNWHTHTIMLSLCCGHYNGTCILCALARLSAKFLNNLVVRVFSLHFHSSLFAFCTFEFDFILQKFVALGKLRLRIGAVALAWQLLLIPPILNINSKSLGREEPKPLQRLLIQARIRECILPQRNAQMHDHESEVVGERVSDEKPLARAVLEPDLRFWLAVLVHVLVD